MEPPYEHQRLNHTSIQETLDEYYNMSDPEGAMDTQCDESEDEADVEEDDESLDPDFELYQKRALLDNKLKSRFEAIFEKYGRDFSGVGDEVDLATGEIVIDNGHLIEMQNERDTGISRGNALSTSTDEEDDEDEEDEEEDDGEEDDEDDKEILGSTEEDSDNDDSEISPESVADDGMTYGSDTSSGVGLRDGLHIPYTSIEESEGDVIETGAFASNPAAFPSEDQILAQFGPHIGPQIIKYVGEQGMLENSRVEPAWRTPGLPISTPGRRPLLKSVLLQPDKHRSASPEESTSIWAPENSNKNPLRPRKPRIEFTKAEDELIVQWVSLTQNEGYPLWGSHWDELERTAPHHSSKTYKQRYRGALFPKGIVDISQDKAKSNQLDLQSLSDKLSNNLAAMTSMPMIQSRPTYTQSKSTVGSPKFNSMSNHSLAWASTPVSQAKSEVDKARERDASVNTEREKRSVIHYSKEEDAMIIDWYSNFYRRNRRGLWVALAEKVGKRSQYSWESRFRALCRLGMIDTSKEPEQLNNLDVSIRRSRQWTKEEDAVVQSGIMEVEERGQRYDHRVLWAELAEQLPGRTFKMFRTRVRNLRYKAKIKGASSMFPSAARHITPSTSPHTRVARSARRKIPIVTSPSTHPSNSRSLRARQAAKQNPGTISWSEALKAIESADPFLHAGLLEDIGAAVRSGSSKQQHRAIYQSRESSTDSYPVSYSVSEEDRSGFGDRPKNALTLPSSVPNSESKDELSSPEPTPPRRTTPEKHLGTLKAARHSPQSAEDEQNYLLSNLDDCKAFNEDVRNTPASPHQPITPISSKTVLEEKSHSAATENIITLRMGCNTNSATECVCAESGTSDLIGCRVGLQTVCTGCSQLSSKVEKQIIGSGTPQLPAPGGNRPLDRRCRTISPLTPAKNNTSLGKIETPRSQTRPYLLDDRNLPAESVISAITAVESDVTTKPSREPEVQPTYPLQTSSNASRYRRYNSSPLPVVVGTHLSAESTSPENPSLENVRFSPRLPTEMTPNYISPYPPANDKTQTAPASVRPKLRSPALPEFVDEEEDELSVLVDDITALSATPLKQSIKAEKAKGHLKRLFDEAMSTPGREPIPEGSARGKTLRLSNSKKSLPKELIMKTTSRRKSNSQLSSFSEKSLQNKSTPKRENHQKNSLQFSRTAAESSKLRRSPSVMTPGGTERMCGESGFRCERDFCFTCEWCSN